MTSSAGTIGELAVERPKPVGGPRGPWQRLCHNTEQGGTSVPVALNCGRPCFCRELLSWDCACLLHHTLPSTQTEQLVQVLQQGVLPTSSLFKLWGDALLVRGFNGRFYWAVYSLAHLLFSRLCFQLFQDRQDGDGVECRTRHYILSGIKLEL